MRNEVCSGVDGAACGEIDGGSYAVEEFQLVTEGVFVVSSPVTSLLNVSVLDESFTFVTTFVRVSWSSRHKFRSLYI